MITINSIHQFTEREGYNTRVFFYIGKDSNKLRIAEMMYENGFFSVVNLFYSDFIQVKKENIYRLNFIPKLEHKAYLFLQENIDQTRYNESFGKFSTNWCFEGFYKLYKNETEIALPWQVSSYFSSKQDENKSRLELLKEEDAKLTSELNIIYMRHHENFIKWFDKYQNGEKDQELSDLMDKDQKTIDILDKKLRSVEGMIKRLEENLYKPWRVRSRFIEI